MTRTTAQILAFLHLSGEWLNLSPDVEQMQINVKFCAAVQFKEMSLVCNYVFSCFIFCIYVLLYSNTCK